MSNVIEYFKQDRVVDRFEKLLGDKSQAFITSVLQCVSSNAMLSKATPLSVYNAAATAAAMDLPINSNLGFAYIVPYKSGRDSVAQFQLGYKGFIQLAQRTGLYKRIAVSQVYEGQLVKNDPLEGCVFNWEQKKSEKIVGYVAYFRLLNGFESTLYMSQEDVQSHAKTYSKSYSSSTGIWKKNPVEMSKKTVLKLLLSKYGPLSIDMQKAMTVDQSVMNGDNAINVSYVDNPSSNSEIEQASSSEPEKDKVKERAQLMISDCKTIDELNAVFKQVGTSFAGLVEAKRTDIKMNEIRAKEVINV